MFAFFLLLFFPRERLVASPGGTWYLMSWYRYQRLPLSPPSSMSINMSFSGHKTGWKFYEDIKNNNNIGLGHFLFLWTTVGIRRYSGLNHQTGENFRSDFGTKITSSLEISILQLITKSVACCFDFLGFMQRQKKSR